MERGVLDGIINKLLEVRGRPGKQVQLSEPEIKQLCLVSRDIFSNQPNLLELDAPLKICGTFLFFPPRPHVSISCSILFFYDRLNFMIFCMTKNKLKLWDNSFSTKQISYGVLLLNWRSNLMYLALN